MVQRDGLGVILKGMTQLKKTKICNLKKCDKYKMKLSVFPFFGFHFVKKIIQSKSTNHLKKHFIIHDFEISTSSDSSL